MTSKHRAAVNTAMARGRNVATKKFLRRRQCSAIDKATGQHNGQALQAHLNFSMMRQLETMATITGLLMFQKAGLPAITVSTLNNPVYQKWKTSAGSDMISLCQVIGTCYCCMDLFQSKMAFHLDECILF